MAQARDPRIKCGTSKFDAFAGLATSSWGVTDFAYHLPVLVSKVNAVGVVDIKQAAIEVVWRLLAPLDRFPHCFAISPSPFCSG